MTIFQKVTNFALKLLGVKKLSEDPNDSRFNFINDEDTIREQKLKEYKIWYVGDAQELDNFYLNRELYGNNKEPYYNRNYKQYFWGLSEKECNIKKIHSGIPRAVADCVVKSVGNVTFESAKWQDRVDELVEELDLSNFVVEQVRPLTAVEGYGAIKPTFNKKVSRLPMVQFYEAIDIKPIFEEGILIGIIFKDYYSYQGKNYVLLETRNVANGNSYIKFNLFRLSKSNEATEVALDTLPSLENLPAEGYIFEGVKEVLGILCRYKFDPLNKEGGLSIYAGKTGIADDMDQILSVESLTERNSGPVEYYPVDLLKRDKNGTPQLPKVFGRTYVKKPTVPGADGGSEGKIDTSAPDLNFSKYSDAMVQKINLFCLGLISPSSLGNNIARNDNAEAMKEKGIATTITVNDIINKETKFLKKLMQLLLMLEDFMESDTIILNDYSDISVKYKAMANPSFESMAQVLAPLASQGLISEKEFVNRLYGDTKSEEEKNKEIKFIQTEKQRDSINFGDINGTPGGM